MAGDDKPEFPPLLRPGRHEMSLEAVRRLCVARFPDSVTRPGLMLKLNSALEMLNRNGMRGKVWIDGSFLTEKLNPDDVDLILWVESAVFRALAPQQRAFLEWFRTESLWDQYRIDNYAVVYDETVAEGEYMYAYWLRQFGFSRGHEMKGLAVVTLPYLVAP